MKESKVVVAIYSHPEYYPPTLNMLSELSRTFDKVVVLSRNVINSNWEYPDNVIIKLSGKQMSIRDSERSSLFFKVLSFAIYTFSLLRLLNHLKPSMLVLCDSIPTFSYFLINPVIKKKHKIWYHNHDVLELKNVKRYSISWFSYYTEKALFKNLDIFSLPNDERKMFFPLEKLKGHYCFLPNYPLKSFYSGFRGSQSPNNAIRIIYQGEISPGHGLEEIISVLSYRINTKKIELILVGRIADSYKNKLNRLALKFDCVNSVIFMGHVAYRILPTITESCHIGIGIYTGTDVMNKTIATSSNKIYEYLALGLPVLIFNDDRLGDLLNKPWALPSNLEGSNILNLLEYADLNYQRLSIAAMKDAQCNYFFENYFERIVK